MAGAFALALALAALTAGLPQHAAAQAAVPCTAIADDSERLACYDRALRAAQAPAAPPPAAPAAQASAAPAAQTPAASAAQTTPLPTAPARIPAVAAPSAAAATSTATAAQAATHEDDDAIISIVIVGVRANPGRETSFTAQDGATWVQTDSQRVVGLPDPPFDAELKPGAMGSKFLVPAGRGRAIRVRAVEP